MMKYKYIDTNGNVVSNLNRETLKKELKKSYENWNVGSGDAAIESNNVDLIIVKLKEGIFIMQLSDYSSPIISENTDSLIYIHSISGEPMNIPGNCLCDEETAVNIIDYFIKNDGKLSPNYNWVDIFEYLSSSNE